MTTWEHLGAVSVVALAGLAGAAALGGSMRDAMAGEAWGRPPSAAAAPTGGPNLAVAAEAGVASALAELSDAERIAQNFAEAPAGLYGKLEPGEAAKAPAHASGYWRETYQISQGRRFSATSYRRRVMGGSKQPMAPAHETEFDLLTELSRLDLWRVRQPYSEVVRGAVLEGKSVRWSNPHAFIANAIAYATVGRVSDAKEALSTARRDLRNYSRPIPEDFFDRILAVAQIHGTGKGPTEERFERLFRQQPGGAGAVAGRAGASAAAGDVLFDVLGRYPSAPGTSGAFAFRYLSDAGDALATLDEGARRYLEGEVLPLLRQTESKSSAAAQRVLSDEGEARVVSRIVHGDVEGALAALAAGRTKKSGDVPADLKEAVRFAASLFEAADPAEVARLTPFGFDELMDLVRFEDEALARLAARPAGGAELADVARAVRAMSMDLLPGRSADHADRVFTEWLRTVARADRAGFDEYAGYAARVVREVPVLLREVMEDLLRAFSPADAP